ncbi:UDP-2,3-diacylglucosamine diphosphatase [Campylobacter showae]|uniref:Pyridine nucleotide-disulfide oxidoreductase YkgC n=1 Tax=Campylobacter showae CC57C TaxID=1073353 RepID=M3I3V6_9BACT|nr:UDP-2,3-diacylglucosamine diphosphatase [Campylobacter showae]EMG31314.1 pyridine nucleotide-disulfide oxidoreductase YkgC [Campylobacter showae CC57C]
MPEQIVVKSGAIFIADSHENENRENFWHFLCALKSGEIKTPQLFLMGDMFDFLASECEFFVKFYERYIHTIDELGEEMEIYYFEGNHDFNLARLFKNVKAYPIGAQPVKFASECGQSVLIAHGDIFLPFVSKYVLRFLRVKWFLKTMNFFDKFLNFRLSKQILNKLKQKILDYKIPNFKNLVEAKMRRYNAFYEADVVIEGHYHQGEQYTIGKQKYINIPSFACKQSYFVVEYGQNIKFARKSVKV